MLATPCKSSAGGSAAQSLSSTPSGASNSLEKLPVPTTVKPVGVPPPKQPLKPVETRDSASRGLRSPASALFDTTYQGGSAVDVFSAGGSNPCAPPAGYT